MNNQDGGLEEGENAMLGHKPKMCSIAPTRLSPRDNEDMPVKLLV
jgi:hypothetical protein